MELHADVYHCFCLLGLLRDCAEDYNGDIRATTTCASNGGMKIQ